MQTANLLGAAVPADSKGENWLIQLISTRDIEPFTPLCYDYGAGYPIYELSFFSNKNIFANEDEL